MSFSIVSFFASTGVICKKTHYDLFRKKMGQVLFCQQDVEQGKYIAMASLN